MNLFVLVGVVCTMYHYTMTGTNVEKPNCMAMVRETYTTKAECLRGLSSMNYSQEIVNRVDKRVMLVEKKQPAACIDMNQPAVIKRTYKMVEEK